MHARHVHVRSQDVKDLNVIDTELMNAWSNHMSGKALKLILLRLMTANVCPISEEEKDRCRMKFAVHKYRLRSVKALDSEESETVAFEYDMYSITNTWLNKELKDLLCTNG